MESRQVEKLETLLKELRNTVDEQVTKKLELEMCHRIVEKVSSFSSTCEKCDQHLMDLEKHLIQLKGEQAQLGENDFKLHKQKIEIIRSHLMKQHKLVTSGHYLSIYMSIGTSLGLVFGLVIFDNIGLGLPLGIGIGVAIGAGLDADAKKKDMVL
ncbi:hypothetical protein [Alkalihalobacterium alkalinitrilicum]|uniref:hypothetical protein n=1 Tax=Alkalihalobacterium alkalinitrilicum TaxID=427920 RepID=UPI001EE3FE60|nr:hypothetical protein [Alkalihalobacterium alkalinitrilicum]